MITRPGQDPDLPAFVPFPSLARLSREMVITEKLDGTNAQIHITEDGVYAGSRNRWLTCAQDNFGFARWVESRIPQLRTMLGLGTHYGEWWGNGIQRGYGLAEKRFSLFNTHRWLALATTTEAADLGISVVPVLGVGIFDTSEVDRALAMLAEHGSYAAPGFMKPEGIVVFHTKAGIGFKKTLDKHDGHKGAA